MLNETITLSTGHKLGPGEPCYIIAEIGINHNGSLDIAKKLIDEAVAAKATAVKPPITAAAISPLLFIFSNNNTVKHDTLVLNTWSETTLKSNLLSLSPVEVYLTYCLSSDSSRILPKSVLRMLSVSTASVPQKA